MNIRIVLRVIVCGLILPFIGQAGGDQSAQLHSQRVFKIGVLATLTGSGFTLGQDTVAALQIAEEQLEADAISQHGGYHFKFFVRDTQHDPLRALEAIQDLDRRGVQIIIGPQTSSELAMIRAMRTRTTSSSSAKAARLTRSPFPKTTSFVFVQTTRSKPRRSSH